MHKHEVTLQTEIGKVLQGTALDLLKTLLEY